MPWRRNSLHATLGGIVIAACFCLRATPAEPQTAAPTRGAFFDARQHESRYAGPGRELPEPADVDEVRIGYFGPHDPADPDGGDMWQAATLALEEANRQGGYHGKPFRLVPAWSKDQWGTGVVDVTRLVYREQVWAIVGGPDGPSTHLAEQVVAKARLTLISPGSTDRTANLANVPWMFSCLPGDHLQAPVLAEAIAARRGEGPFLLASADDHDSRMFTAELMKCLAKRRVTLKLHLRFRRTAAEAEALASRVAESEAASIAVIGNAHDSATLIGALRDAGVTATVYGGPAVGRRRFIEEAGASAAGVVFPRLHVPSGDSRPFERAFVERVQVSPDYAAAATYDAVRLVIAAIHRAGLNRARIRDAVRELSPYDGAAGAIRWDALGSNARPIELGTIGAAPSSVNASSDSKEAKLRQPPTR